MTQKTLRKFSFVFPFFLIGAPYCSASDLEAEFKRKEIRVQEIQASNLKIIKESEKIICGLHEDWGNVLYRKGDNLFKADPMSNLQEIKQVATLKDGKFEWRDRRIFNHQPTYFPWVMNSQADGKYEVFVKFPVIGVSKYSCTTSK